MTNVKYLTMSLLVGIILLMLPTMVNAADTFTTNNGITVTKIVDNYKGNIQFKLTNIELNSEGNYVWGVGTTSQSADITKWYTLGDFTVSQKVAILDLVVSEKSILSILRSTNNAYLYVKNYDTDEMVVDGLNVDLTLPPYQAFTLMEYGDVINGGCYYVVGGEECSVDRWKAATYNIQNVYFKFEKVTDENLINSYNDALINGTSVDSVFSITTTQIADMTGWNLGTKEYYFYNQIPHDSIPNEKGTYILYLKGKDTDTKTVYGYKVIQLDADGPTVEKIYVSSPESGTYKTRQTVKIRVGFSEPITGSTVPTLKIKFGDSEVREVTNGTIVNSGNGDYYWQHYIEYSYDIQDGDKGQLATVEITGGNIKDSSGNEAKLSCPVITGNTIKANVEGTTTNNTQNQDQTNNQNNNNDDNDTITKKSYGNHTYYIFEKNMTWAEAKAFCEQQGGYLATITSKEEQAFIESYVKEKGYNDKRFWLGATGTNKSWKWITEEKFDYTNWGKGQPDLQNQSYVVLHGYETTYNGSQTITVGQWDNLQDKGDSNSNNIYFICEWGNVTVDNKDNTTTEEKDDTVAKVEYSNAGAGIGISAGIVIVISVGAVVLSKYRKLSDI